MQKRVQKIYDVVFFETVNGNQPVRDFIIKLTREDQKELGADIRVVQENFPIGLPLVRKLKPELWEIRSDINNGISRVFFTFINEKIILLHAIVKKTQKTPPREIDIAIERLKEFKRMQKQAGKI
ncbi:MAG: type II toxin-antitoxin system RelE/ParE family toxin [Treponema sp.]|jgi:phage-related protein|nr:type II toxin-antitoxin system RelE/ParE family toxin [Treponema sp.]